MTQSLHDSIHSVAVIGAGTMGRGIAHVLLRSGYSAMLADSSQNALESAPESIARGLARDVEKARLTPEAKDAAVKRLAVARHFDELIRADFVIEAVAENFETKAGVFRRLNSICRAGVIFSSNTSSISITRLASAAGRPRQFVGLHFFNPVPVISLVELVAGVETAPETLAMARSLAESMGKTPVEVNDYPGFVSNRVLMPMINEAVYAVMEGVAPPEAVDQVMKLGMNHPMGPLELADFIGLDVCLDIMKVLHQGFSDSKYRPCPLLEKMVHAGRLGRKSGRGFYQYKS